MGSMEKGKEENEGKDYVRGTFGMPLEAPEVPGRLNGSRAYS